MNLNKYKMSSIPKGILSDYEIDSILGKGTFSTVKLATDIRTNEKIAIKILEKNKIKTTRDLNRINREINIAKNINHLNIVQFYEIKEDLDKYYILMEYCENGELFDLILSKKKLSEDEAAYYFYQLVNGLEYIHMNNIIHRDLKPENLLLTKNNILKIIDFGLSNYNPEDNLLSTPCGSPCYASPEMVSGKKYNGFTNDVWSLGIILYAMIYGYLPFENENNNDLLFRKIRECKVDYPKNNCVLALDLLKKILVRDFNERITIDGIKRHKFYLKGKFLFRRKHRGINGENKFHLNLMKIKKILKKNNLSELNSNIIGSNDNDYNLLKKRSFNINITDDNTKKHKLIFYKKNITNIFPENIIKINHNNKSSKNKFKQKSNQKRSYFSTLTTNFNNKTSRETFNYNINNEAEMKLNLKYINSRPKRDTNNISLSRSNLDKTLKIKSQRTVNLINKDLCPLSSFINYSDKFPDFNSFSIEKEDDIFKEFGSESKINKSKDKKENYCTSEIRKIISDKKRIKIQRQNKELKPISFKNLKANKILNVNTVSLDKNQFKKNYIKKYQGTKIKLEKNNNNQNNKNKDHKNNNYLYKNLYLNNDFFNISKENNKYNNTTNVPYFTSRLINKTPTNNNKNISNFNNKFINNKYSEDKIKINRNSNYNFNKRLDSNLINSKLIKSYIEIPNKSYRLKKISLSNLQREKINSSGIINENNDTKRTFYGKSNILNVSKKEKSMEKERKELLNKSINYIKNYKFNNRKSEYAKIERNKNNHETFIYKNLNNTKYKNDFLNNEFNYNRYMGMKNKEREEISKLNSSYDNDIKFNRNSRINNGLNINISKFKMSNFPSITIDMNVLNKNNIKYLKLYDAIKNKL